MPKYHWMYSCGDPGQLRSQLPPRSTRCHVAVLLKPMPGSTPIHSANAWVHVRSCLFSSALGFGQRHPSTLVRAVIGISHLGRGIVVLEEGHEYWRRVAVGFA